MYMSDNNTLKNTEPNLLDKTVFPLNTINELYVNKFIDWIENSSRRYYDNKTTNLKMFFSQIFNVLKENNMCFSSGSFVFQNDTNIIFNLLTFNTFVAREKSYYCNDPSLVRNVNIIGTATHMGYYSKYPRGSPIEIKPRLCMPPKSFSGLNNKRIFTKFDRTFDPEIKNFCGYCRPLNENLTESKGVVLYYPFTVTSNNYPNIIPNQHTSDFLFVKFEHASAKTSPLTHTGDLLTSTLGIKRNYADLDTRREEQRDYGIKYLTKDMEFYEKYCPEDIPILEWFNTYVRTGSEFFISNNLLVKFLLDYFYKNINCPETRGGKKNKFTKRYKKTKRNIKTRFKNIKKSFKNKK